MEEKLPTKCVTPTIYKYWPDKDKPFELIGEEITYCQELIGILRWAIEVGREDILLDVTLLSSQFSSPPKRHMDQMYYIFGYLK